MLERLTMKTALAVAALIMVVSAVVAHLIGYDGRSDCQKAYDTSYLGKGTSWDEGEQRYCDEYNRDVPPHP